VNICTIIARNYLAQARILAESFKRVHPDGTCTVLVIDDPTDYIDPANEQFELLTIDQIGLPDVERMAAFYDVMELSTAVKPWLLRTLLARPGVDSVSYLDPDIQVFSSLAKIEEEATRHGIVLTPHFTAPLPRDGEKPSEEDILMSGSYNLGFIGLGAGATADALLDWWSERLESDCINNPADGYFVDQRWIDLAPGFWPDLYLLRETTYNIAYWNLPTRTLEADGDGYRVDGEPLRFFHFSGYDPRAPHELSKHQTRIKLNAADPALKRICDEYGEALRERGYAETTKWPYGWNLAADGVKLDKIARSLYREGVEEGRFEDSVFAEPGAGKFHDYLVETVAGRDGAAIGRYAATLWESRDDLREAYPDLNGVSAEGFVRWLHEFGPETGASQELLTPDSPTGVGTVATPGGAAAVSGGPPPIAGVNVLGYISSERGVGEAARQAIAALDAREIPNTAIDTPTDPAEIATTLGALAPEDHPYDYNLICVNADMLPAIATAAGSDFFARRRTAGLWFWEVSKFPEYWLRSFDDVDEVWVATEHIADALRPLTEKPVRTVRLPIAPGPVAEMSRAELGLPEGFCFLFVFDYRSVFRRKNALGLVEAFCSAFKSGEGPSLVIKSICGDEFPAERAELAEAIAGRPDIDLIEETIAAQAKNAMIANCDAYVSLHRSEGLGLTMAEAMYHGKPVIATGYSGNLDFMTPDNSYLVPYSLTRIGIGAEPYPPDGDWADPDLAAAARLMKQVVEDPEGAAQRGRRAALDIRRTHSPETAAASIEARIAEGRIDGLVDRLRSPGAASSTHLEHLISFGGPSVDQDSTQIRDAAKRAYIRVLRPYIAYQDDVNASAAKAMGELAEELNERLIEVLALDQRLNSRISEIERKLLDP
jgi:glycosyltransferase involved in cell wall biosynthesis